MNATIEAGAELIKRINMESKSTAEMFQSLGSLASNTWVWVSKGLVGIAKYIAIAFVQADAAIAKTLEKITWGTRKVLEFINVLPHANFDARIKELSELEAYFNQAAEAANKFTLELLEIGKAPPAIPFMPTGGSGEGDGKPEVSYQDKMLWHDAGQITDMWLKFDKGKQDAHKRSLEIIAQMDSEAFATEQERKLEQFTLEGEMLQQSYGAKEMLRWEHDEKMLQLQERYESQVKASNQKIVGIERQSAQVRWQIAESLATTMATIAGAGNKALFLLSKAFAMAQAVMYTHLSATIALATPPAPNVAAKAAALKLGYSQVALIAATAIGGMVTGSTSGGGAGKGGANYPDVGTPAIEDTSEEKKGTINFNIQGDFNGDPAWIDNLVERINDAGDREVFVNWSRGSGELVT